MSRQYDQWVFMQEEPLWDFGPTGRVAQIKQPDYSNEHYRPFDLAYHEQLRIEDEIIARHIEDHESEKKNHCLP